MGIRQPKILWNLTEPLDSEMKTDTKAENCSSKYEFIKCKF